MSDERDGRRSVRTADPTSAVQGEESSYEKALAAVDELRLELNRREVERRRGPRPPPAPAEPAAGRGARAMGTSGDLSSSQEPAPSTQSQETRAGWAVAAIAGVVAAVAAATVVGVVSQDPPDLAKPDAPARAAEPPAPDGGTADIGAAPEGGAQESPRGAPAAGKQLSELFFNERAGYGFRYPEAWSLERAGEVARVVSPDGTRVVSFALGPTGSGSLDSFASLLERSYEDVRITARDRTLLDGDDAVALSGSATNSAGDDLLFQALVLQRPGQRAVGAFAASRSRPKLGVMAATIMRSLLLEH